VFHVAQDLSDPLRESVRSFVAGLKSICDWYIGPPVFLQDVDANDLSSPDDVPVETLGGYLEIYSSMPPWSLPAEVDSRHYREVTALISALRDFSRREHVALELALDGTFVGTITEGEMDKSLVQGLLEPWKRQLGQR
jgi:hypothetical protein